MRRTVAIEVAHMLGGLLLTWLIFAGAAWGYPEGRATIRPIGWLTMVAIVLMSTADMLRAGRRGTDARKSDSG